MIRFLSCLLIVASVAGCQVHDHPNRSAKPLPGDINGDGLVDETDLDLLNELLGIDPVVCPPAGDCNLDGVVTFADALCLFEQLCEQNNCNTNKCRRIFPRPHSPCFGDD